MKSWLRLFRVVNLPTVPGDVLVGAAVILAAMPQLKIPALAISAAALASCALYLFGLADNDIVGAASDRERPIPEGLISMRAARLARCACLFAALVVGSLANLPSAWWITAFALALTIVAYNRTKLCVLMGLCRALNVLCGSVLIAGCRFGLREITVAFVWFAYVTAVTLYSNGEETDAALRRRVGFLVGAIVYLQLTALMLFPVKPLLIAGAVLLVLLRILKRSLPKVSAS